MKRIISGSIFIFISIITVAQHTSHSTGGVIIMDSVGILPSTFVADSSVFFDNSIGFGTGVSNVKYSYPNVFCKKTRSLLAQYSVSGTTMQVDGLAKIPLIPQFGTLHRWLIIGYLENDADSTNTGAVFDTAHCGPVYRQFVDTALARGWPASRIILRNLGWTSLATFTNNNPTRRAAYIAMVNSVASTRGTKVVDILNPELYRDSSQLMWDGTLHPGDWGAALVAQLIYAVSGDSVRALAQGIANNRTTELNGLIYDGTDTASQYSQVLGRDSSGKVGVFAKDQIIQNSNTFAQPQAASLNLAGRFDLGYTGQSPPPAVTEAMQVKGTAKFGALRVTTSLIGGTTGSSGNLAFTGGVYYIYAPGGEPIYMNTLGGGAVSIAANPVDNTTKLNVGGGANFSGAAIYRGSIAFNTTSGDGTFLGYTGGAGYISAYKFSTTAVSPLFMQYQGGNETIGKNTDYGLAQLHVTSTSQAQIAAVYDATHYATFTTGSGGSLGIAGLTGLTINSGAIPTGTTTDSVLVETTSSNIATVKKVAQSSIGANIYNTNGTLTGNRTLSGATNELSIGTSGSHISNLTFYGDTTNINGGVLFSGGNPTNANLTVGNEGMMYLLPGITANRTITLPSATNNPGRYLIFPNLNTAAFTWSFSTTVNNADGTTVTTIPNGFTYVLQAHGTSGWIVVSRTGSAANSIVAEAYIAAQTAANNNFVTYTAPADGMYRIGGYTNVTAIAVDVMQLQVSYTDETNTARTVSFVNQGATSANITATGPSQFPTMDIRAKSGTAINISAVLTTGTGSIAYNAEGSITLIK